MNPEKQPVTHGEVAHAADQMSEKQKELSSAREEGYKLGRIHERDEFVEESGKLKWNSEVNGVKIAVDWVKGADEHSFSGYEVFFPQLNEEDHMNAVITLSADPVVSKKVYEYACKAAEIESDPRKVRDMVVVFCDKLGLE